MAKQLQLRKGTATEHATFTGANGEVTVDTTNKTLRVHDGSTVGGIQLATTQGAVILNNTLTSTSTNQALTAAQGKVLQDNKLDKTAITVSGSAPMYACRAWVNFDGTTGAIRASGNVSSVTSEGGGTYLITFTQGMSDANYVVNAVGSARYDSTALAPVDGSFTTSSFRVRANYGGDNTVGSYSPTVCCVTVFR